MAVNRNPIRRRLAEACALSVNELEGAPLRNSTVKPNPADEPEIRKYDMICSCKLTMQTCLKSHQILQEKIDEYIYIYIKLVMK